MNEHDGIKEWTRARRFRVLHQGWECDPWGWVATRPDGASTVLLTDHGVLFEAALEDLQELLQQYEQAITETHEAMTMVGWPIDQGNEPA